MTGFARSENTIEGHHYCVEIKSVNHRYLDTRVRLPPGLSTLETAIAEAARKYLQRGSVEITVRQKTPAQQPSAQSATRFIVDEQAAHSFQQACQRLQQDYGVQPGIALSAIQATGKILLCVDEPPETSALEKPICALVEQALVAIVAERKREGAQTQRALAAVVEELSGYASQWARLAADHPRRIRERLQKRLEQWNLSGPVDAQRLELEVAFFADRADISEEIQRFNAHLETFTAHLQAGGPAGRKLDFLTQELHRETNTIASKADNLEMTRLAVAAKTAIEKLREQVQNVE